jgi:RHS repeat-associated protein
VQNLHYTYDPTGNVTHIQDDAQQTIYFRNKRVEPSNDYTYDALYRLIQATGREHLGQQGNGDRNPPTAPDGFNTFPIRLDHPNVLAAMGTYVERYVYDAVGNFLQVQHRGSDPAHAGWTRAYDYAEASLIEPGGRGVLAKANNRLTRTTLNPNGASLPAVEPYRHDVNGNIVRMPHLGGGAPGPNLHWDCCDRLRAADLGGGGAAYYVYDASGQRVRKVWEKSPGLIEERIYLGAGEIFRQHPGAIGADTAALERETVHVMDDKQRIAVVETRTLDRANADLAPRQQIRYQHGNHLGSGALELDQQADIVSYEEYTPYGSSSYQAVRSQTETAKRYRYTGKERDEESGFYYHGARYYAPWLARWTSVEPNPMEDGANAYVFCRNSPTRFLDANGRNSVEDLFKFLRDTGGFTAADMPKGGPPQFTSAHASPFGTSAHQAITNTLDEIKGLGKAAFKGIERIYGEVAVQHGTDVVQKIGGSPIRGHHNLDLVAMPQGQTLSVNQTLAAGAAEAVGDAKFGGGSITSAHSNFGQTGLTVNGASTPAAGPSLGAAAETEQAFSTLAKEFATESSAPKAPAANATASFDANVARATWKSLQGAGPKGVLSTLKSGAGKIVAGGGKVLGVLGNVASVAGAFVGGYQVGSGINQVTEGKVGLGTTDIVGGSAQLGVAIGVPAAVKAGAVVGGGAGALALVSGLAALSIGWAVEDTKRALEGKKTMTDEAVEYWSQNGVTKTFQDLWWQIKN